MPRLVEGRGVTTAVSASDERSMSFRASAGEAMTALEEAARRTGMRDPAADAANGVVVFTAGSMALAFGQKVTARVREVAPGTVQGRLPRGRSSVSRYGVATAPAVTGCPTP